MPRSPFDVEQRLACLGTLQWRTQLEHQVMYRGALLAEVAPHDQGLRGYAGKLPLSPRERELIERPLGSFASHEIGELVWRNEAMVALLWSLDQLAEMPPYTTPVATAAVMERIAKLQQLAGAPTLREARELARAHELASLWNWRGRTESFRRGGMQPPAGDSFAATVARATASALADKLVDADAVADGDLVVGGTRYADLDQPAFVQVACIAHERHWALEWLTVDAAWDDAMPST